jgi:tellurite resistance protein TehA-like permease
MLLAPLIALWSFVALMKKLEIFSVYSAAFESFSLFLATMMIGFGLFWLVYAVIISWHYGKIPYSLAYWAYVFPLNALGISIALSAAHPVLSPLKVLVVPMWFAGLVLWLYVFYKTLQAVNKGAFSPSKGP